MFTNIGYATTCTIVPTYCRSVEEGTSFPFSKKALFFLSKGHSLTFWLSFFPCKALKILLRSTSLIVILGRS